MEVIDAPIDDKAKRMRDLLSSFYSQDNSTSSSDPLDSSHASARYATLDSINTTGFDADQYMNLLVQKSNLNGLLQKHVEMASEIKNLDTDLQMLVYENYSKFISATDTIKRMKSNIVGMEVNMEQLLEKILSVQSRSDGVNTSLCEKREHIEKLHRTRNLLRKVQFIYDLPTRLGNCISSESYADAVRLYTGAMPIFEAYGDSSFLDCKMASEEAIHVIINNLQEKVFSDSESIQKRAESVMLLKQLDIPSSTRELVEAVRAYGAIFPDSKEQLIKLLKDLVMKHFEAIQKHIIKDISVEDLLELLRGVWTNVLLMDEVLPEASLPVFAMEAAHTTVNKYIASAFSCLLLDISDPFKKLQSRPKERWEEHYSLQAALDAGKKTLLQGSVDKLLDFRQLLEETFGLLPNMKNLIIDWVQEGFQDFFGKLDERFHSLSGKYVSVIQGSEEGLQGDKVLPGVVLVIAQLSLFVEKNAVPRITEEIAAAFSGGSARGHEHGPAFVPAEICRNFRVSSEKFLNLYIKMRTEKISGLLRKRFTTPNWVKHKEPREVHMFVDFLLQEVEAIGIEVKQILPEGPRHKHRRTDSNGSTTSSRSNTLRDDRMSRLNTHRARSQLLETHLAKLFKQKVEIFTKIEHTQESVLTTILKLSLKSLQEFVRLHTYNRSGFQQIQLDTQFLRTIIFKEIVEDEAAVNFLLDEVIVAAAERCLDPIPLETPILDKLIHAKLKKSSE
ncbi:hypothetical protein AgCh_036133 [Apium graveolens]